MSGNLVPSPYVRLIVFDFIIRLYIVQTQKKKKKNVIFK